MIHKFKQGEYVFVPSDKVILRIICTQWVDYSYVYVVSQKFPHPTVHQSSKHFYKMYVETLDKSDAYPIDITTINEQTFKVLYGS